MSNETFIHKGDGGVKEPKIVAATPLRNLGGAPPGSAIGPTSPSGSSDSDEPRTLPPGYRPKGGVPTPFGPGCR